MKQWLAVTLLIGVQVTAQQPAPLPQEAGAYEPNAMYPYGRRNPAAPPELEQFEFMLGANQCQDAIAQADGSWTRMETRWNAAYFLNGYGIQDKYWTPGEFSTSNIRLFDPQSKTWKVTFFSMPSYSTGMWEGAMTGEAIVLSSTSTNTEGKVIESRLSFYAITDAGFEWKSELFDGDQLLRTTWTSSCKKVLP